MKEIDGRIKIVDSINTIHKKDETVRRPPLAGYPNLVNLVNPVRQLQANATLGSECKDEGDRWKNKTVDRINTIHKIRDETVRRPPLAKYLNLVNFVNPVWQLEVSARYGV